MLHVCVCPLRHSSGEIRSSVLMIGTLASSERLAWRHTLRFVNYAQPWPCGRHLFPDVQLWPWLVASARASKRDVISSAQRIQWNPLHGTPGAGDQSSEHCAYTLNKYVMVLCERVLLPASDCWWYSAHRNVTHVTITALAINSDTTTWWALNRSCTVRIASQWLLVIFRQGHINCKISQTQHTMAALLINS